MGDRPRAQRPAAFRGRRGRCGAGDPRAAGVAGRGPHRAPARHRQRHDELHPHRDGAHRRDLRRGAGGRPGAGLRRGRSLRGRRRPRRRREDGDPRPAGLRHPGLARRRPLRGHRADRPRRPRVRARPRARPQAPRHRRAHRRRPLRPCAPGLPLRRPPAGLGLRAVQRRHRRVAVDHRDHDVRPRRGRPADRERGPGRRHQRHDPARLDAADQRRARGDLRHRVGLLHASRGGRPARRARGRSRTSWARRASRSSPSSRRDWARTRGW